MAIIKCPKCGEEYDSLYSFGHTCKGELDFWWGNFWIATTFLGAGLIIAALIYLIYTGALSIKDFNSVKAIIRTVFGIGFGIIAVVGLLKRKKWGLRLVYVLIILSILGTAIEIIKKLLSGPTETIEILNKSFFYTDLILNLIYLFIGYLWFKYFYRRREWFK